MPITEGEPIQIPRFAPQEPSILSAVEARIKERVQDGSLVRIGSSSFPAHHYEIPDTVKGMRIFTAPQEPIYEIEALNAFMADLVTGIDGIEIIPTELPSGSSGDGQLDRIYAMRLGRLSLPETVGTRTEIVDLAGSQVSIRQFNIKRTSALFVYPHRLLAEAAFGDSDFDGSIDLANYRIKHEWVERLKQGQNPFQKPPVLGIRVH